MLVYLFLIVYLVVMSPLIRISTKGYLFTSLFPIWIVMALRSFRVGGDTLAYTELYPKLAQQEIFGGVIQQITTNRFESGFILLNKLLYYISSNPRLLIVVVATIEVVALGYFVYNFSSNLLISLVIFVTMNFMPSFMNAMRQGLAVSCLMIAVVLLLKKRDILFFMLVLVAGGFHKAAIVFLLVYPVYKIGSNAFTYILLFLTVTILFSLFSRWFEFITNNINSYEGYVPTNDSGYLGISLSLTVLLVEIVFCFLSAWPARNSFSIGSQFGRKSWKLFIFLLCISFCVQILALKFSQISRVGIFFDISSVVLIPRAVSLVKSVRNRVLISATIILFVTSYFIGIQLIRPEWFRIVPYSFM